VEVSGRLLPPEQYPPTAVKSKRGCEGGWSCVASPWGDRVIHLFVSLPASLPEEHSLHCMPTGQAGLLGEGDFLGFAGRA